MKVRQSAYRTALSSRSAMLKDEPKSNPSFTAYHGIEATGHRRATQRHFHISIIQKWKPKKKYIGTHSVSALLKKVNYFLY